MREWNVLRLKLTSRKCAAQLPESLGTTAVQVLQSDLIRRFREQELELDRKAADMAEQYGARHPAMIQVQAQRQELRNKIRDEIQRITKSLENQVRIAQTREASLASDLDLLKSKQAQSDQASIGLRALERNAEANRLILQKMMASSVEAAAQNDMASQVSDVRVVSPASIPERPSFPRPLVLLPMSLLAGTAFGVVLAFALEKWQAGFWSAEQRSWQQACLSCPCAECSRMKRESVLEYLGEKASVRVRRSHTRTPYAIALDEKAFYSSSRVGGLGPGRRG